MPQIDNSERAGASSGASDWTVPSAARPVDRGRPIVLLAQLLGTLAIIAFVPTNMGKTMSLLVLWGATFGRIGPKELALFIGVCGFFTVMNAMSLAQGIFSFSAPDFLGMPVYEFFMWGFYVLHTKRLLDDEAPSPSRAAWALAVAYAIAFASIKDAQLLLFVTGALLTVGVILFHTPRDLAFLGYMVLLGAAVEYTGVWSGQWVYPGAPVGGVPPWFVTLWGGVGLFFHRLILPLMVVRPRLATA